MFKKILPFLMLMGVSSSLTCAVCAMEDQGFNNQVRIYHEKDYFCELPEELQQKILGYLDTKSLVQLSQSNLHLHRQTEDDKLWERLARETGVEKRAAKSWRDAYTLSTRFKFWKRERLKQRHLSSTLGSDQKANWEEFTLRLEIGGVAFIKRTADNERNVLMLLSALNHIMNPMPGLAKEDFLVFDKEYSKIQFIYDSYLKLNYTDIQQIFPKTLDWNKREYWCTWQKGALPQEYYYPLLCQKIDNAEGMDVDVDAYKIKVLMPKIKDIMNENEVDFYLVMPEKTDKPLQNKRKPHLRKQHHNRFKHDH